MVFYSSPTTTSTTTTISTSTVRPGGNKMKIEIALEVIEIP